MGQPLRQALRSRFRAVRLSRVRVLEAFRNQRYYPNYVKEFAEKIQDSALVVPVKNNRTPVILEVPFSPDLTVGQLVDVIQDLLGITLQRTNYEDIGTSAGPAISLTIDRIAQPFKLKLSELDKSKELELWITIVWRDEVAKDASDVEDRLMFSLARLPDFSEAPRDMLTARQRGQKTVVRTEQLLECLIWDSARALRRPSS